MERRGCGDHGDMTGELEDLFGADERRAANMDSVEKEADRAPGPRGEAIARREADRLISSMHLGRARDWRARLGGHRSSERRPREFEECEYIKNHVFEIAFSA